MLAATSASTDWGEIFMNSDLAVNYRGYTSTSTASVDPLSGTWPESEDLFAGNKPDLDYGCI